MQKNRTQGAVSDDQTPHEHRSSYIGAELGQGGTSLTRALLDSHPEALKAATESHFLQRAGTGRVSKKLLSRWLSQDRLYAETYICFITSLIARVTLPYAFVSDKSKSLRWRIIHLLTGALDNIHKELEFFTTVAQKYGLELDQPHPDGDEDYFMPEDATKQYMELFRSFQTDPSLPLIEGLVVLWATEQCYLTAWSYAAQAGEELVGTRTAEDADGGALREEFIPNWSSKEFQKFVDDIAAVTDQFAEREQANKKLEVYKAVWLHVLDIEKAFWPSVDGEP